MTLLSPLSPLVDPKTGLITQFWWRAFNGLFVPGPPTVGSPADSAAKGTQGQIMYDDAYLYICVAPNSWRRVATSTF